MFKEWPTTSLMVSNNLAFFLDSSSIYRKLFWA